MIIGIGCDLIKIARITSKLAKRILSIEERILFDKITSEKRKLEFLAGRFAAKEAFSKALGTGIGVTSFKDIVVLNNEAGKPYIDYNSDYKVHISITHTDEYALAYVVIEKK